MSTWKKILTEEDGNIGTADQTVPMPGNNETVTRTLLLQTPESALGNTNSNFRINHYADDTGDTTTRFNIRNFQTGSTLSSLMSLNTSDVHLLNTGDTSTATTTLKFYESGSSPSNYTSLQAASSISSNVTLILPKTAPNNGDVLYHTISNQLAFASPSSIFSNLNTNIGNTNLSLSGTRVLDVNNYDLQFKNGNTILLDFDPNDGPGSAGEWMFHKQVVISHSSGTVPGQIKFREPAQGGVFGTVLQGPSTNMTQDVTFVLPDADGNSGDVLQTDGSGNLSFAAGGGGVTIDNYAEDRVLTAGDSSTNIDAEQYLTYQTHTVTQSGSSATPTFLMLQNQGVVHCKSNGNKPSGFMLDATNALGDTGLDSGGTLSEGSNNGSHIVLHFASFDLTRNRLYTFYDSSGPAIQLAKADASATSIGFIGYYVQDTVTTEASAILMTEGIVVVPNADIAGTFTEGGILYLDNVNAGKFTFTIPSTSNHYVRHLGYALYQQGTMTVVYFKPSTDFIQLN